MQEEQFWDKNKAAFVLATGIGLIVTALFARYSFSHPESSIAIEQLGNIKEYVLAVLLWGVSSVLSFMLLHKILPSGENKILGWGVVALAVAFFGYAGFELYKYLDKGSDIKYILVFVVFTVGTIVVYQFVNTDKFARLKDTVIVFEILGFSALWCLCCSYLNTFTSWSFGTMYNVFHSSAYIDSISNVFFGHPYKGLECDLYGHYGLFFIIPMKLFGPTTKTIGTMMGLIAALTFAAFGTAIHLSVKQFIVKLASIAALGLSGILAVSIYWQSFPHRLLFPALTILAITVLRKVEAGKKFFFIGLILTVSAVIWNFESGILCAIAWGIYGASVLSGKINRIVLLILSMIISVASSCLGALLLLNIYNKLRNGPVLGFKHLIGFAEASNHISSISSPIEFGNAIYIHAIITCMICALWGLWKFIVEKDDSENVFFSLVTAILGLGIVTYYVNDSEGGPTVFLAYFVIALTALASGVDDKKDCYSLVKKAACLYACTAIFVFGAMNRNFWKSPISIKQYNCYNYNEFQSFADGVNSMIAPDTKGGGMGVSALFLAMGRDDGTDDFYFHMEDVQDTDHFLTVFSGQTEMGDFALVNVFGYNEVGLGYYERIPQEQ